NNGGSLFVNGTAGGSLPAPITQSSGGLNLASNATVGAATGDGGTYEPRNGGLGPANTRKPTLRPAATLSGIFDSTTPGSFGHTNVIGTVILGNATLSLTGCGGCQGPGESWQVISNDGSDPIVGTFAGLPEGGTLINGPNGLNYTVTYAGGDGNDLVLT